jgi:hypothetical protein
MFKKIFLSIVCLFCFVGVSNSQMVVPYTKTLEQYGFNNYKRDKNLLYFRSHDILVIGEFDSNYQVINSTIAFDEKESDSKDILTATYISYLTLQTQLGKDLIFNYKAGLRKMKYLFDTIIHNLKLSNNTKFNYDDLKVIAGRKGEIMYVVLQY